MTPPKNGAIRPTTDRVKESMFAILGDLRGTRVLDLFAGTGSLGLEALSRGAAMVAFVESDPRHIRLIERNLLAVKKAMGAQFTEAVVVRGDASKAPYLAALPSGPYDIIIADPPYRGPVTAGDLVNAPAFAEFADRGIVVVEHHNSVSVGAGPSSLWKLLKSSSYGKTRVSFLRRMKP